MWVCFPDPAYRIKRVRGGRQDPHTLLTSHTRRAEDGPALAVEASSERFTGGAADLPAPDAPGHTLPAEQQVTHSNTATLAEKHS